jgi:hypothetical protein
VVVAKEVGDPFALFDSRRFKQAVSGVNNVVIGHNRYATQGGINRRNAHPFEFDTLVGVHNGTLMSKWRLADAKDFVVDSENLYHHIEKHGLQDAINQLTGHTDAWALVWWNKEEDTLNFLRNDLRPLFMCRSEDGNVLFWASERWMLEIALSKNDIKRSEIFSLDENLHHSVYIDKDGKMEKPFVRRVEVPKPLPATTTQTGGGANTTSKQTPLTVARPHASCDPKYVGRQQITFECLGVTKDAFGGVFVLLFDEVNPYYEVRLYLGKEDGDIKDHAEAMGHLVGNVSNYVPNGKGYYKVSPHSVTLLEEVVDTYPTHQGDQATKEEWEKKYKFCDFCGNNLFAEDLNRFTTKGECFCPDCVKKPEVKDCVTFVTVH